MRKLYRFVFETVMLPLLLSSLLFLIYLNGYENQKPCVYILSMQNSSQSHLANVVKLVNKLLYLNESVYWLSESLNISAGGTEYALASGDFIFPFYQNLQSDVFPSSSAHQYYVEELFVELGVPIFKIYSNIEARVYPLKRAKVGVFYGGGVTGGSLEHIYPLEDAGFSLGILLEENLLGGNLFDYDIVIFPGGGPYLRYLSEDDMETIRSFVERGGGFLGTCGGLMLGIELGLLDAEAATVGQYEAYADLRGPVLLNLTTSSSPAVFGYSSIVESMYFWGPFISRVGSNVETIGSYYSKTKNISLYFPEIAKAYNYTPKTQVIESFWGSPSIITGKYGSGKVILSAVHPEVLPVSQRLLFNSIFYLSCGEEFVLRTSKIAFVQKLGRSHSGYEDSGMVNETLLSQIQILAQTLRDGASDARRILTGLEELNNQIVGVSGEYLTLFIDDIKMRSAELLSKLGELHHVYENFESTQTLLRHRQPLSLGLLLIYRDLLFSTERLQSRILSVLNSMSVLSALNHVVDDVIQELSDEKSLLQQILSGNMSTALRYQQIINLHVKESLTLVKLKDDVDYHLLNWCFEIESVLAEAHLLSFVAETYTH